jgi:hypothetical protein
MAASKGLIVGIVLGVCFLICAGLGGLGYVGWRYYQAQKAILMPDAPPPVPEMPTDMTPEPAPFPEGEPTTEPTPEEAAAEMTPEPTAEPTEEPTAPPAKTQAPPKKTRTPKTPAPTEEPEEEPVRTAPPRKVYSISHVHGGLTSKKSCTGTLELTETGFKYDAQSSEDDREDHVEVRFGQVKKAEMKGSDSVEISTTEKKWTFRGDGLTVAKLWTHLNAHSAEFAGK